jgi:hypothetical protein
VIEYGNTYEGQKITVASDTIKDSGNNNGKCEKKSKNVNPAASSKTNSTDNLKPTTRSSKKRLWYDRCLYKCGSCPKTYTNGTLAGQHVRRLKHKKYTAVRAPQYKCKICRGSIRWNRFDINKHARGSHGLSFEGYVQLHEEHLAGNISQANEVPQLNEKLQETEEPQTENSLLITENMSKNDWYDMCVFQCNACYVTFESCIAVNRHKKSHKHKGHTYVTAPSYACKICNSSVLWQKDSIRQHLYKVHKYLSLEDYGREYESAENTSSSNLASASEVEETEDVISSDDETSLCRIEAVKGADDQVRNSPTLTDLKLF